MAKFTSKDFRLKDYQKVIWGSDLDSNIWWDDSNQELCLDTVISGIYPTSSVHLTTRQYVDDEISTLSGSIVLDHGGLTGLGDDDHTQYVLVDGTRGFTSTVSGVDPIQDYHLATKWYIDNELATLSGGLVQQHHDLLGLDDDDHDQYILVDGTRAFTGVVGGITPTADDHLTTKQYVDTLVQGIDWQESVINISPAASGIASEGNRYIASETSGGWTEDYIYEYTGTSWSGIAPDEGMSVWVEDLDYTVVYNGTDWVRLGSTVTHEYLAGLQGGTSSEYYHLTSDQHSSLTDTGGVENASDMHIHDDRYYTEAEIDATISGLQHHDLGGLGDDDHDQYILVNGNRAFTSTVGGIDPTLSTHLTTKNYVDNAIATLSGVMDNLEHDQLGGLDDDDHTQYILVDGTRGFTNTVSGVTPVSDSDLATKAYVDQGGIDLHGRASIANGASVLTVSFSDLGHETYTVNATMENTADSPPSMYAYIISARTSSSFTVSFSDDMDSANYVLNWTIIED